MAEPESGEQSESEHRWLVRGLAYALEVLLLVVGLALLVVAMELSEELSLASRVWAIALGLVCVAAGETAAVGFGVKPRGTATEYQREGLAYFGLAVACAIGRFIIWQFELSFWQWLLTAMVAYAVVAWLLTQHRSEKSLDLPGIEASPPLALFFFPPFRLDIASMSPSGRSSITE